MSDEAGGTGENYASNLGDPSLIILQRHFERFVNILDNAFILLSIGFPKESVNYSFREFPINNFMCEKGLAS